MSHIIDIKKKKIATVVRKDSKSYELLKQLAMGSGVIAISLIAPRLGGELAKSLRGYFRKDRIQSASLIRDLKSLQRREMIDYRENQNGEVQIKLTNKGREKILMYELDDMSLKKPAKWDGKWRLIMFDIPHTNKLARDALRKKLNDLKFYPIQKSVFITPYPCEDEIDFIGSIFDVRDNILFMEVSNFDGEEKLKKYFEI